MEAYTHHSFWQLYATSKPFRENIYNPDIFVRYSIDQLKNIYLTRLQIGYEHKSNGQYNTTDVMLNNRPMGNISRGIDMLYGILRFEDEQLHADLKFWVPISSLEDNPDLMDYMGYTSLELQYEKNRQVLRGVLQGNFITQKGSLELSYGYPIGKSVNLYIKGFSGYVDTLVDYNQHVNKIGVGFSFSH
ncbi:MAG: phospholipase A [Epsilonproteobacteria bacterium]|nr:phospholipase A [Campylobacterota bacterium]